MGWLSLLIVCLLGVGQAFGLHVDVSAQSAVLMDAQSGAVLFEKNAHQPLYPASITKVITALYALSKKGEALDELVTASHDAVATVQPQVRRRVNSSHPPYRLEFGGTHIGIKVGEDLPLRSLIYGLMLESGNDAANVIAQHVSGSVGQFIEELNQFIQLHGCHNTTLFTPHGLHCAEHKTTAYDMALLTVEALKHPFFCEVVKSTQHTRPQTNKQMPSELYQRNALIKSGKFHYSKALGVKTGYTAAAGYTLVAAAEDENRKLVAVLLGGYEQPYDRYKDAIALFEAAFREQKVSRTLFAKGFDRFSIQLSGAKRVLEAEISSDVELAYYPSEKPQFSTQVNWFPHHFPIKAGQCVGEVLLVTPDQKVLVRQLLFAKNGVESTLWHRVILIWIEMQKLLSQQLAWVMGIIGVIFIAIPFVYFNRSSRF